MTNFDAETCNESVISDVEAKEIALQLSGHGLRSKTVVRSKQQEQSYEARRQMGRGYLQATYPHLHGRNQVRKLNDIFAMSADCEEERASTKCLKRRLQKMEVVDEQNVSYEDNCEVNELSRELQSLQFGEERLRPIITFTPVHSGEGEHELEDYPASPSSFCDHVSSGSSSPLLEVPTFEFQNMTAEMMRPLLN